MSISHWFALSFSFSFHLTHSWPAAAMLCTCETCTVYLHPLAQHFLSSRCIREYFIQVAACFNISGGGEGCVYLCVCTCVWRGGEGILQQPFHSSLTGKKKCITPYKSLQCRNLNLLLGLPVEPRCRYPIRLQWADESSDTNTHNYFTALERMSLELWCWLLVGWVIQKFKLILGLSLQVAVS